jgi:FKBP-type peptidyl-prolyl cis-trans isomerase SlyD
MQRDHVEKGHVVTMEYTLHVDGEVLDSSQENGPLQFLAGYNNIIPGLEREMIGMKVGEDKDVVVAPKDGYGEFDNKAFIEMKRSDFPKEIPVEVGVELNMSDKSGQQRYARIHSVDNDLVRLDLNHPLAGRELHFNVKVVDLREPTQEEAEHGHVHAAGGHEH